MAPPGGLVSAPRRRMAEPRVLVTAPGLLMHAPRLRMTAPGLLMPAPGVLVPAPGVLVPAPGLLVHAPRVRVTAHGMLVTDPARRSVEHPLLLETPARGSPRKSRRYAADVTNRRASTPFGPIASAFGLYLFLVVFNLLAAALVPWLLELWERSPRLGALGWFALIASPAGFVAMAHHATHALMDRFDVSGEPKVARGLVPRLESIRAGLFAWFVISFASMASALLFLVIFPPPPGEDTLSTLLHVATDFRLQATLHALLWVGVAALLYDVERRASRA